MTNKEAMTSEELEYMSERIWTGHGWQARMARELDVTPQTINNWMRGRNKVPVWVKRYVEMKVEVLEKDEE